MANTYEWADGARVKLDAQSAGEALEQLVEENDGILTPTVIMEAAKPNDAPLHDAFTWDDDHAAYLFRVNEARYLTRSLIVVYRTEQGEERHVRAFVSLEVQARAAATPVTVNAIAADRPHGRHFTFTAAIPTDEDGSPSDEMRRGYVHISDAMQDESLRLQIMGIARREIMSWRKRYGEYREFAQIFATIDELAQMKLELA